MLIFTLSTHRWVKGIGVAAAACFRISNDCTENQSWWCVLQLYAGSRRVAEGVTECAPGVFCTHEEKVHIVGTVQGAFHDFLAGVIAAAIPEGTQVIARAAYFPNIAAAAVFLAFAACRCREISIVPATDAASNATLAT